MHLNQDWQGLVFVCKCNNVFLRDRDFSSTSLSQPFLEGPQVPHSFTQKHRYVPVGV